LVQVAKTLGQWPNPISHPYPRRQRLISQAFESRIDRIEKLFLVEGLV
jgi:hypothetical protein